MCVDEAQVEVARGHPEQSDIRIREGEHVEKACMGSSERPSLVNSLRVCLFLEQMCLSWTKGRAPAACGVIARQQVLCDGLFEEINEMCDCRCLHGARLSA